MAFPRRYRAVWWLIVAFWGVYGTMGVLHYRAYRTTIQDLGVYDRLIWALSNVWPFPSPSQIVSTFGHFSPIVALHVLAYKIYPSAVMLIGLQVAVRYLQALIVGMSKAGTRLPVFMRGRASRVCGARCA